MSLEKQVVILFAAVNGYLDDVAVDRVSAFEADLHQFMDATHPEIGATIAREKEITAETEEILRAAIQEFKQSHLAG